MFYGLDVHKQIIQVCRIDETGKQRCNFRIDAHILAQLLRADFIPEVEMPGEDTWELRQLMTHPGAAPGRSVDLIASPFMLPKCGTGRSWPGSGKAGICRRKWKIYMPERGGVGPASSAGWARLAAVGGDSDCRNGFVADIMAPYTNYPLAIEALFTF